MLESFGDIWKDIHLVSVYRQLKANRGQPWHVVITIVQFELSVGGERRAS